MPPSRPQRAPSLAPVAWCALALLVAAPLGAASSTTYLATQDDAGLLRDRAPAPEPGIGPVIQVPLHPDIILAPEPAPEAPPPPPTPPPAPRAPPPPAEPTVPLRPMGLPSLRPQAPDTPPPTTLEEAPEAPQWTLHIVLPPAPTLPQPPPLLGPLPADLEGPDATPPAPAASAGEGVASLALGPDAQFVPSAVSPSWNAPAMHSASVAPTAKPPTSSAPEKGSPLADVASQPALAALLATSLLAPAWALYRRIVGPRALDSPQRARILDHIRAQPGVTPGALRAATGMHYTSCLHHVRVLADAGFVDMRRVGGQWRCFPREQAAPAQQRWAVASQGPTARALLALVAERPGVSPAEAARALGITRSAMQHHTVRLRALGVLEATKAGSRVELRLAAQAEG